MPATYDGDPGYPAKPGNPIVLLPGDPGYPAQPGDPIIIFPIGGGDPIYIWPGDPGYPYNPGDPIIIWPGDPGYPFPPFLPGDPIVVRPGDPGYPTFPLLPGQPIVIYPGDPGYPAYPGNPSNPPIVVQPIHPGYPVHPGDPIIVNPGDPAYPGQPGVPGLPGTPGYPGDPTTPGNPVQVPPGTPKADGQNPWGGLVLASDGFLYGTTLQGGSLGHGVIFRLDTTGNNYTILHSFTGSDGDSSATNMIVAGGWLYGTTSRGGQYNSGVLFQLDITGQRSGVPVSGGERHWLYQILHHFLLYFGSVPTDSLILGSDGWLYGTTTRGGENDPLGRSYGAGTIFGFNLNTQTYRVLKTFNGIYYTGNPAMAGAGENIRPNSLVQTPDGFIYGTTQFSSTSATASNGGTVYKFRSDGYFQVIHVFQSSGNRSDGADSESRLLVGSDGSLYGVTKSGGVVSGDPNSNGFGTIFKLSTSGQNYTQLHTFTRVGSQGDGLMPMAGLMQGADGNLYGTTSCGTGSIWGAVYKIAMDGTGYQLIHPFAYDDTCGRMPYSSVVQDVDGNLYGTTGYGASQGFGAVYKLTPGGTAYSLHKFGAPVDNSDDPGGGIVSSTVHLLSLAMNPTSLTGGTSSTGTVVLDGPAPLQGAVIALSTNNTVAKVFRSVVFSAGQMIGTFTVTTHAVGTDTSLSVTAAYNGTSLSAPLTVVPPVLLSLTLNPDKVTSGGNSTGIVTLSGPAPDGGMRVTLSSSDPTVTVPSVALVRAGSNGVSFLAASSAIVTLATSTIVATLNGVSKQATLTVQPGSVVPAGIVADAFVLSGNNSNTNYGSQPYLLTETDNTVASSNNAVTYLRFDLTHALIAPTAATLKLTLNALSTPANGIARVRIYGVSDITWPETDGFEPGTGINWLNAPSLNRSNVTGTGTLLTTQDVPLSGGVASFDVTQYAISQLGKAVTFQVVADSPDNLLLSVNSREATSGQPALLLVSSFLNDVPAPFWALNVIPTDSSPSGGGPSSSDSVNLASGVEENTPGPDIAGRNPIGPTAGFSRLYRSVQAAKGYASPGLSPGWTHNYDITVQGAAGTWGPLALRYPNGAQERWGPALDGSGVPTGILHPTSNGVPYLVQGIPSPSVAGRWLALTITYKDHTSWTFTPDPNLPDTYLLTRLTSAVGRSITIVYDSTHRIQRVVDDAAPQQHTLLSFQYNVGYLGSISDSYGRTISYSFAFTNGGFCLTGVSQLNASALQWQYDYTAVNGWPMLSSVGTPDPTFVPAPGAGVPILTHPITYYPDGRVATLVDANGNKRLYTYAGGTQVQVYSPTGALVDHWTQASGSLNNGQGYTDANNFSNLVSYDDPQNPYRPTQYTSKDAAHPQSISATYDQFGNTLTTQASCNGGIVQTIYQYDYATFALGMLHAVAQQGMAGSVWYTYYPNGLRQSVTIPSPGGIFGILPPTMTYYYTALGNISKVTKPGPNVAGTPVSYTYNYRDDPLPQWPLSRQEEVLGQPLSVTAPDNGITHYRYDARGNRIAVVDALGNRIDFQYNLADQLTLTQLPATGQTGPGRAHTVITYQYLGGPAIATQSYDEKNNLVHHVEQVSGKEGEGLAQTGTTEQTTSTFDADQRLSTLKDGNGNGFAHAYDAVGNLNQLTYPSGHSIHGQYGPDGNLTQFTNARGQNTHATLIPNGDLLQSLLHDDGKQEQISYDQFGRTIKVRDGNTTLDYTYDELNNVLTATTTYANLPVGPITTSYGYNPDGSRASMFQFNNATFYTYDATGRLTDVSNPTLNSVYHYDYDLVGHLIHKKTPQTETDYQYNAASQLVGLTNYDANHNVISGYSSLNYDGAGNLLHMTVTTPSLNPLAAAGPFTVGTVDFTYDNQDHLTRELSHRDLATVFGPGPVGNFDNPSVSDPADNLTRLRGVTYSGNVDNQVTADSHGAAYGYDADGVRHEVASMIVART